MITVLGSPRLCCNGVTRRETLKAGGLSLLGGFFNLPSLLALESSGNVRFRPGKAKSVILLFLQGGPATQDMFDLKPDAPSGVRSEFKPIATSASGYHRLRVPTPDGSVDAQGRSGAYRQPQRRMPQQRAGIHGLG